MAIFHCSVAACAANINSTLVEIVDVYNTRNILGRCIHLQHSNYFRYQISMSIDRPHISTESFNEQVCIIVTAQPLRHKQQS